MTKTSNPIIRIHDMATGEIIDRPMSDEELAQSHEEELILQSEKNAIASAKATKVAAYEKLGLTVEEIAALG
jgi:hypothetical protein